MFDGDVHALTLLKHQIYRIIDRHVVTKNRPHVSRLGGLFSRPLEMRSALHCLFENASLWPPILVHTVLQF